MSSWFDRLRWTGITDTDICGWCNENPDIPGLVIARKTEFGHSYYVDFYKVTWNSTEVFVARYSCGFYQDQTIVTTRHNGYWLDLLRQAVVQRKTKRHNDAFCDYEDL